MPRLSSARSVVFVLNSFVRAGSQRHFLEIIKAITSYRPDVTCKLLILSELDDDWGTFYSEALSSGISVDISPYSLVRLSGNNFFCRVFNWLSRHSLELVFNIGIYVELAKARACIACEPYTFKLLFPFLRFCSTRFVFHLNEHAVQRSSPLLRSILSVPGQPLVLMHKSQMADLSSEVSLDNCFIFNLGIFLSGNPERLPRSPRDEQILRIAHYSRISPMRFVGEFIQALSLLRKSVKAEMRIVGHVEDSEYYESLKSLVRELNLDNGAVRFEPPVDSICKDALNNHPDLVWLPSVSGFIGYASIESIAAGLPLLCLDLQGSSDYSELGSKFFCADSVSGLVAMTKSCSSSFSLLQASQYKYMKSCFIIKPAEINQLISFYFDENV